MKQNKKIKKVILGCGRIASHYVKIFKSKKINNCKLVGFFDININKASFFAKKFSTKAFANLDKMLDETIPDLAIILNYFNLQAQSHGSILHSIVIIILIIIVSNSL